MIFAARFCGTVSSGITGTVHPEYSLNLKNYQVAIVMLERIYYKSGDKFILEDLNALKNKVNYKKQEDKAAQNCLMCFGTGKVEKSFVCNLCNGNNGSCTNCGGKGRVKKNVTCNHN